MRQDHRTPFERALLRTRASAYAPGEFVGQESFMTAGEIRALAVEAVGQRRGDDHRADDAGDRAGHPSPNRGESA